MTQEIDLCNIHGVHFQYWVDRVVLFEFHLKFWYTDSIGIPARSLLQDRLLTGLTAQLLDGIQIKHLYVLFSLVSDIEETK